MAEDAWGVARSRRTSFMAHASPSGWIRETQNFTPLPWVVSNSPARRSAAMRRVDVDRITTLESSKVARMNLQ